MKASRGCIIAGTSACILVAIITLLMALISVPHKIPGCIHCGSRNVVIVNEYANGIDYRCRVCDKFFQGPPKFGFSWADAAEGISDQLPNWVEGESWTKPVHCTECGAKLTRLDNDFVECKKCGIKIVQPKK